MGRLGVIMGSTVWVMRKRRHDMGGRSWEAGPWEVVLWLAAANQTANGSQKYLLENLLEKNRVKF